NEEQIDRHVGKNQERDKRNSAFPLEIKNADVAAPRRDPIATAVNDEKQDRQTRGKAERFDTRPLYRVRVISPASPIRQGERIKVRRWIGLHTNPHPTFSLVKGEATLASAH